MTHRRRAARVARWAAAAGIVALIAGTSPVAGRPRPTLIDLKVAVRGAAGCGQPMDSLGSLVVESGVQPGDESPPVSVCFTNAGNRTAGLSMAIADPLDRDVACSPAEADHDPTCGGNLAGEMSQHLTQVIALDPRCRGQAAGVREAGVTQLTGAQYLLYEAVPKGRTYCATLTLRYAPPSIPAQMAAQSDVFTWRYLFALTG